MWRELDLVRLPVYEWENKFPGQGQRFNASKGFYIDDPRCRQTEELNGMNSMSVSGSRVLTLLT
jgi:hypothetical protein